MSPEASTFLPRRITVGIFLGGITLASLYCSILPGWQWLFFLFVAALDCAGLYEYYHLVKDKGVRPLVAGGILVAALYLLMLFLSAQERAPQMAPTATFALGALGLCLYYFVRGENPLLNLATTLFGIFYLAVPAGFVFLICYGFPAEAKHEGPWWVLYLLAVTKMTDVGAYFSGRRWGKTKLAPFLSPNKTIEGAYGGFLAAVGTSLLMWAIAALIPQATSSHLFLWDAVMLGAVLSIMAQMGDLTESLFKRDAGIKHSSGLLGVGGFLDILDSVIFTTPTLYFFLIWRQIIGS